MILKIQIYFFLKQTPPVDHNQQEVFVVKRGKVNQQILIHQINLKLKKEEHILWLSFRYLTYINLLNHRQRDHTF